MLCFPSTCLSSLKHSHCCTDPHTQWESPILSAWHAPLYKWCHDHMQTLDVSVQFSRSVVADSLRPHEPQHARPPCHHQSPDSTQTHAQWVSDAIHPFHPLSSPFPPALNLSQHQGFFKWVSSLHHVAKYWNFSFSISPSNEHPGLISFKMDWLDLLAVQGTHKSLLQHHSSKESILPCSVSL